MARSLAIIQDEIRARTESCMSMKKNDGFLNQTFSNPEKWRGQCEGYARRDLGIELAEAELAESSVIGASNDAFKRTLSTDGQQDLFLILGAFAGIALIAYLLFSK